MNYDNYSYRLPGPHLEVLPIVKRKQGLWPGRSGYLVRLVGSRVLVDRYLHLDILLLLLNVRPVSGIMLT